MNSQRLMVQFVLTFCFPPFLLLYFYYKGSYVHKIDTSLLDAYSLSHSKWLCKYHIVFTPKYRRKIEFNQYKQDILGIVKKLCKYKGIEIIEVHIMPECIYLLILILQKYSVSSFMGYLKGKSSLMIFYI